MGLFNYVEVDEAHIPKNRQCEDYQTKTYVVPLVMDTLQIAADGRLMHCVHIREITEDANAPLGFWLESVDEKWVDTHYHGDLSFYGIRDGDFIRYTARFTDGWLASIKERGE